MKPQQVRLIQQSFELVVSRPEATAALFYERLFSLDPSLQPLFKSDLKSQGRKLMATLALVVRSLDQPHKILPSVQHLGQRHVTYGVKLEHYQTVGEALLWTLAQALGRSFTEEVRAAWEAAYFLLAHVMLEAAEAELTG